MDDTAKENTEIITSPKGGRRQKIGVRFDLIPHEALYEIAKVFAYGAEKYEDENWKGLDFYAGEQAPLNHGLMHLSQATTLPFGSPDRIRQLAKAATNSMMQLWGELSHAQPSCGPAPEDPETPPVLPAFTRLFGSMK